MLTTATLGIVLGFSSEEAEAQQGKRRPKLTRTVQPKATPTPQAVEPAVAETPAPAAPNRGTTTARKPSWTDRVRLTYYGQYYGWRIPEGDFANYPEADGTVCCESSLFNQITTGVRLGDKGWSVNFLSRFEIAHASWTTTWFNPRLSIATPSLFKVGPFNFTGNLLIDLPLAHESRRATGRFRDMAIAPSFFTVMTLDMPKTSAWTLGAYINYRYYVYSDGQTLPVDPTTLIPSSSARKRQSEWYLTPFAYYKLSSTMSWLIQLQVFMRSFTKDKLLDYKQVFTNIETGPSWDLTPDLSVNPYIEFYTSHSEEVTSLWKSLSFGVYISGTVF